MLLNTPEKWWAPFTATTPQQNKITGLLCRNRGAGPLAGALLVKSINGTETNQLLPGMPEIPYPEQTPLVVPAGAVAATFTRKLDGTAVLFSPLQLPDKSVEVFPRTRGMPVLWDTPYRPWRQLVAEAVGDKQGKITLACSQQRATLVFELWGHRNQHIVHYPDVSLQLSLHSIVRGRTVLPWRIVAQVARAHKLPVVSVLERITRPTVPQIERIGRQLAGEMETQNSPEQGLYREEGTVLIVESNSIASLWKFKPESMAEFHRLSRRKIRPVTIRHELFKLLEAGHNPSVDDTMAAIATVYGDEGVKAAAAEIQREYWLMQLVGASL